MAAVEKLDGNINPQINMTGPRIGKNDCLKECNLLLKWTKFLASKTNKATFANSDGWKVNPAIRIHLLALDPPIVSPPLIAQIINKTDKP